MERWIGRVAVVTGASSGIGAATVVDLATAGMIVIGLARRKERVDELSSKVPSKSAGKIVAYKCDVAKEDEIKNAFAWIESNYGGIDVLVNNAGIPGGAMNLVDENNTEVVRSVIDVNLMGVVLCTREAFQSMKKRNFDGHIVLINSIGGHSIPVSGLGSFNIYPATKYGITALTEIYRQEFNLLNTKIKITSISPGFVDTEIFPPEAKAAISEMGWPALQSKDISDAILYVLGTPPHVQVHELTIKPVGEKF